jgi:kumamolisin
MAVQVSLDADLKELADRAPENEALAVSVQTLRNTQALIGRMTTLENKMAGTETKGRRKKPRSYVHRPRAAPKVTYGPLDIAKAYSFPTGLKSGAVIAIIELGGGYLPADIQTFCAKYNIPLPTVTDVSVDGVTNSPGDPADLEVALDIELAAGVFSYCTGQPANVRVYFADDIAPAVAKIIADKQSGIPIATVSISWGDTEDGWGASTCQAEDAVFAGLAAAGVTMFCAAGDSDSGDGEPGKHVDFPASSPHVVGCGGTTKTADSETVWNSGGVEGTGGGYSAVFPAQSWQASAPAGPGRMVPDVSGNADPATGYYIYCSTQGGWEVVGGTSAVSPLYAGLFAAINPGGDVLNALWANQNQKCFADIVQGNNGAYAAGPGPDPCSGLGVPIGGALAAAFQPGAIPPAPPPPSPPPAPSPSDPVLVSILEILPIFGAVASSDAEVQVIGEMVSRSESAGQAPFTILISVLDQIQVAGYWQPDPASLKALGAMKTLAGLEGSRWSLVKKN